MLPILQVGPLALPVPGLVIIGGFWLGLILAERNAYRFRVNSGHLSNLALIMLVSGAIGGRIIYAIRYWDIFTKNISSLFSRDLGLFDIAGGLACALIAGLIYGQRKRMLFLPTLDSFTPLLAVMGVAIALAHLASGSAFGAPADLPWSIVLWGTPRHPSQIYELLCATAILVLSWPGRSLLSNQKPGIYFLAFGGMTAAARLFLEAFRGDSQLLLNGVRSAQLISWLILAACLIAIFYISQRAKSEEPGERNTNQEGS